ncbi:MAG: hypothetical protein AB1758_35685 [Candidatus Eremiobacterota bacterium]
MLVTTNAYPTCSAQSQRASGQPGPSSSEPRDQLVIDKPGGLAAGVIGLVMAGGAYSFSRMGSTPLAVGFDCFIGASVGAQMAGSLGKSKLLGAAAGAGAGLALAAAGIYGGWPGALGAAAVAAVLRGVVLPTVLARQ